MYRICVLITLFVLSLPAYAGVLERKTSYADPVTIDWANWDSSYSSGGGHIFTDLGYGGPATVEGIDSNTAVAYIRYRSGSEARYASLLRRSGTTITEVDRLALSEPTVGVASSITYMGNNRILGMFFGAGIANMTLLERDGDTLTELDNDRLTSFWPDGFDSTGAYVARLTDTTALLWYAAEDTSTGTRSLVVVNTSGDTITFSSVTNDTNSSWAVWAGGLHIIDEDEALAATKDEVSYVKIVDGVPTVHNTVTLARNMSAVLGIYPVFTNKYVIASVWTNRIYCDVYWITGGGNVARLKSTIASTDDIWPNFPEDTRAMAVDSANGIGIAVGNDQNQGSYAGVVFRLVVNDSTNVCTLDNFMNTVSADHTAMAVFPASPIRHVIQVGQDGVSSPIIDAVSYKVFDGATP